MITIICTKENPWSPKLTPKDGAYMCLHPAAVTHDPPLENGLVRSCPICGQEWRKDVEFHHTGP